MMQAISFGQLVESQRPAQENAVKLRDTHISLAHGNGGRLMRELIEELFVPALANPHLDTARRCGSPADAGRSRSWW